MFPLYLLIAVLYRATLTISNCENPLRFVSTQKFLQNVWSQPRPQVPKLDELIPSKNKNVTGKTGQCNLAGDVDRTVSTTNLETFIYFAAGIMVISSCSVRGGAQLVALLHNVFFNKMIIFFMNCVLIMNIHNRNT